MRYRRLEQLMYIARGANQPLDVLEGKDVDELREIEEVLSDILRREAQAVRTS